MTRLHKIYALLKQNYKTTKIPDVACACNTDSCTPPHLLLKLFQNFIAGLVYMLWRHCIYCFSSTIRLLPTQKQTDDAKICVYIIYCTNKNIFLLGKNNLITCSHPGQLLTIPAGGGSKQYQETLVLKPLKKN